MRFMMLLKSDEQAEAGVLPDEKIFEAMQKYNDDMLKAGAMLAGEGLHPTSRGARIKFRGGKPVVTDGPFAEAKEVIAGYWLIQANSRQEAIDWALRCPFEAAEGSVPSDGTAEIEVRQLYELSDFPVGEDESGWREHEAEYREAHPTARPPEPGKKRFIIFRMADKDTEAEIAAAAANEAVFAAMDKYNQQMIDAGVMVAGEGLHPSSHGAKVYYHKGKRSVVDGPFTEAKELIAGFTMIEVASRDEAIAWVKRWPAIDAGGEVELQLRQVFGTEDFGPELPPEVRAAEEKQRAKLAGKL